ncbi:hypothetical protein NDU88_001651, partial [Pleurodeles waltl]
MIRQLKAFMSQHRLRHLVEKNGHHIRKLIKHSKTEGLTVRWSLFFQMYTDIFTPQERELEVILED